MLSVLLAALVSYSAARKLTHAPEVVATYALAGVPEQRLNLLAALLFAGAAGLLAGLAWEPLGVAAAAALAVYFAVAVGFHVRNGDSAHLVTPLVLALLATAAVAARLA